MKKFLFRNVKKFLACALAFAVIFSFAAPVSAAGSNYDEEFEAILEAMTQKHLLTNEEMSNMKFDGSISVLDTSAFYDTLNSIDMGAFNKLDYEIPSAIHSQNLLNAQYAVMYQGLQDLGHGTNFAIDMPKMNLGYSKDIQAKFKDTFGDLSHKYDSNVSLPDGWDMETLMGAAMTKRDEYAFDIKNSDAYHVVSDAISANKVVTQAITTLGTPELKDAVTLQNMLDESAGELAGEWNDKSENGHAAIKEIYRVNTEDRFNEDFQELFDEAAGDMAAWLEFNRTEPSEEEDDRYWNGVFNSLGGLFGEGGE